MVPKQDLRQRYEAVGMMKGGMSIRPVSHCLGVHVTTVRRWLRRGQHEEGLESR